MYPCHEYDHYNNILFSLYLVQTKTDSANFIPCTVEITPKATETANTSTNEKKFEITSKLIEERDWNLMQVNHMIAEQLKTKGKETLDFLQNNKNKPDFIRNFLKPLLVDVPLELKKDEEAEDGTKMIDTTDTKEK